MQAEHNLSHFRIDADSQKYFGLEIERIGKLASWDMGETAPAYNARGQSSKVDPLKY